MKTDLASKVMKVERKLSKLRSLARASLINPLRFYVELISVFYFHPSILARTHETRTFDNFIRKNRAKKQGQSSDSLLRYDPVEPRMIPIAGRSERCPRRYEKDKGRAGSYINLFTLDRMCS